jgi:serine/threonine-protein kinase
MIAALSPPPASKPSTLPPGVAGTIPPPQQTSLEDEIPLLRGGTIAKRLAVAGALASMFLVGYCTRGRVDAIRASSFKETASLRAVATGDVVKTIVEEKKVGAAPQQAIAPAPAEQAIVVPDPSKKADNLQVSEDRAGDVPAAKKKRRRAAKTRSAAAKSSGVVVEAPVAAEAPEEEQPVAAAQPVAAVAPAEEAQAGSGGNCTLNINSIPISRVAVDGRPMGLTPAMGVSVAAGTHNVLLVTDTQRKSTSATCKAGETKTISLRLAL